MPPKTRSQTSPRSASPVMGAAMQLSRVHPLHSQRLSRLRTRPSARVTTSNEFQTQAPHSDDEHQHLRLSENLIHRLRGYHAHSHLFAGFVLIGTVTAILLVTCSWPAASSSVECMSVDGILQMPRGIANHVEEVTRSISSEPEKAGHWLASPPWWNGQHLLIPSDVGSIEFILRSWWTNVTAPSRHLGQLHIAHPWSGCNWGAGIVEPFDHSVWTSTLSRWKCQSRAWFDPYEHYVKTVSTNPIFALAVIANTELRIDDFCRDQTASSIKDQRWFATQTLSHHMTAAKQTQHDILQLVEDLASRVATKWPPFPSVYTRNAFRNAGGKIVDTTALSSDDVERLRDLMDRYVYAESCELFFSTYLAMVERMDAACAQHIELARTMKRRAGSILADFSHADPSLTGLFSQRSMDWAAAEFLLLKREYIDQLPRVFSPDPALSPPFKPVLFSPTPSDTAEHFLKQILADHARAHVDARMRRSAADFRECVQQKKDSSHGMGKVWFRTSSYVAVWEYWYSSVRPHWDFEAQEMGLTGE